ncbi:MAG: thermonuclease family protein [Deltaproteobacteria bacterium]|nr:thermonuclease family protein [Deltaproteobacteria bacterium]
MAWAADREPVKVKYVIDGDTLILADNTRLRLIGLDAPEMGREGRADKPWARAARQRLADLAGGRMVELELDEERRDRHGRLLGYLFGQGRLINEVILEEGLARVFIVGPSTRYAERLVAAERRARAEGRGLWADWPGRWP